MRRANEKFHERERRKQLFSEAEIPDVTPRNGQRLPWTELTDERFDGEWSMRPVKLRGYFDQSASMHVEKVINGRAGGTLTQARKCMKWSLPSTHTWTIKARNVGCW